MFSQHRQYSHKYWHWTSTCHTWKTLQPHKKTNQGFWELWAEYKIKMLSIWSIMAHNSRSFTTTCMSLCSLSSLFVHFSYAHIYSIQFSSTNKVYTYYMANDFTFVRFIHEIQVSSVHREHTFFFCCCCWCICTVEHTRKYWIHMMHPYMINLCLW